MNEEEVRRLLRVLGRHIMWSESHHQFECNFCYSDDYIFSHGLMLGDGLETVLEHVSTRHPDALEEDGVPTFDLVRQEEEAIQSIARAYLSDVT